MKKAIAMRCTQKQFDAVKPKLGILKFDTCYQKFTKEYPYLTNYYSDQKNNLGWTNKLLFRTEMIEEWDEKAFLDACGIETTVFPTLEEIKEYFKDAKTIKCLDDNDEYIVDLSKDFDVTKNCIYLLNQIDVPFSGSPTMCKVWGLKDGYAQILTKKTNRLEELEKRISVLENKVDLKKIADMPENPFAKQASNFHSDMVDAMQHAMNVPIPNYIKGNTFNGKKSLIIDDNEYYKVISGGDGARGADNEIVQIVKLNIEPKQYSGSLFHNAQLYVKTISGDYWGLCKGFKIEKASNIQRMHAKAEYAKKLLDKRLTEQSITFANNSSIDAFKKAFDSIDTDPKKEVNRLKLRIEELEAENAAILAGGKSKWEKEIEELKTHNKLLQRLASENVGSALDKLVDELFDKIQKP